MARMLDAYLFRDMRGIVHAHIATTRECEALGILHVDRHWDAVPASLLADDPDVSVCVALATAALGSRLLRLASEIGQRRPLWGPEGLGGVG